MGLRYIFIGFMLLAANSSLVAQTETDSIVYNIQTEYIESFPNTITTRLFYINTYNSLTIKDRNFDETVNLEPNKQNRLGASVAFRSINISYSFAPDFLAENQDNDNSKLFNLNLRAYFGKWMQSLDIYQEKGFFITGDNLEIYLPRTKSFKIGGGTSFIWNENFSFRAIVSQDEKQLKSAGSFIPRVVYYYTKYDIRSDNDTVDKDFYSFDLAIAPSYYYNFVPTKNLLLSAGFSAGLGVNYTTSDDENLTSLLTELNFRGSITYDISNLYFGSHYSYLIINHDFDRESYVKDNIPYFEIFVGYRFKSSKKLVQTADSVNKKLKLKK